MKITEVDLAPLRSACGLDGKAFPFVGPRAAELRSTLPEDMFSWSDEAFPGQLWRDRLPGEVIKDEDLLDIVVLLGFAEYVPVLSSRYQWLAIAHQAGGHLCEHKCFIAMKLAPKPEVHLALRDIARRRWHHKGGHFYSGQVGAVDILSYSNDIGALGLTCEKSYKHLVESVYPIDATEENLRLLVDDADIYAHVSDDSEASLPPNFSIFVIAENSD